MSLVQRHKVLAFFGVTGESTTVYHRMKKFTQIATSKNPIEYNRRNASHEACELKFLTL